MQIQIAKIRVNSESEKKYMETFEHLFVSLIHRTDTGCFCTIRFHCFSYRKRQLSPQKSTNSHPHIYPRFVKKQYSSRFFYRPPYLRLPTQYRSIRLGPALCRSCRLPPFHQQLPQCPHQHCPL